MRMSGLVQYPSLILLVESDFPFFFSGFQVGTTKTKHSSDPPGKVGDPGFTHAFIASISVIVVSELGDKTFFIAAVMAMRHPRFMVFSGAILALVAMTILSALFGWVTIVIPRVYTYYISTLLFAIFGLRMLKEGYYMSPDEGQEELEEVQSDLKKKDDEVTNRQENNRTLTRTLQTSQTDGKRGTGG